MTSANTENTKAIEDAITAIRARVGGEAAWERFRPFYETMREREADVDPFDVGASMERLIVNAIDQSHLGELAVWHAAEKVHDLLNVVEGFARAMMPGYADDDEPLSLALACAYGHDDEEQAKATWDKAQRVYEMYDDMADAWFGAAACFEELFEIRAIDAIFEVEA